MAGTAAAISWPGGGQWRAKFDILNMTAWREKDSGPLTAHRVAKSANPEACSMSALLETELWLLFPGSQKTPHPSVPAAVMESDGWLQPWRTGGKQIGQFQVWSSKATCTTLWPSSLTKVTSQAIITDSVVTRGSPGVSESPALCRGVTNPQWNLQDQSIRFSDVSVCLLQWSILIILLIN